MLRTRPGPSLRDFGAGAVIGDHLLPLSPETAHGHHRLAQMWAGHRHEPFHPPPTSYPRMLGRGAHPGRWPFVALHPVVQPEAFARDGDLVRGRGRVGMVLQAEDRSWSTVCG
jgi:hypothetical protein